MSAPSLTSAAVLGGRAALRSGWLAAVGLAVAILRRALAGPAVAVAWALVASGAVLAARERPFSPDAPIAGALAVLGSTRFLSLVAALWLAGALLGAALRVVYLAGVLPTLGGVLAGERDPPPRFAAGAAFGFARVAAASLLAWAVELGGGLFAWGIALAALQVTAHASASGGSPLLAAAVAGALTIGIAVALAISVTADAAVARAALRGEGPVRAMAAAGARFLSRPETFLLGGMAFGALAALAAGGVESVGALATGFARSVDPMLLVGPQLMIAAAGVLVAAAVDLWWLGTVAVLAGHEERSSGLRGGPPPL